MNLLEKYNTVDDYLDAIRSCNYRLNPKQEKFLCFVFPECKEKGKHSATTAILYKSLLVSNLQLTSILVALKKKDLIKVVPNGFVKQIYLLPPIQKEIS